MIIPILTYGFIRVKVESITAFEAKNKSLLRNPARFAAYSILGLHILCFFLEVIVVPWSNKHLPSLQRRTATQDYLKDPWPSRQGFYAVVAIAARQYCLISAGWFFNACIIYFCLSASNTALYIASRTIFGLIREIHQFENPRWYLMVFSYLGVTTSFTQVPHWALLISAIAFCWLPALQYTSSDVRLLWDSSRIRANDKAVASTNEYDQQYYWGAYLDFPVCCIHQIPRLVP
jgi:amino acid transporter